MRFPCISIKPQKTAEKIAADRRATIGMSLIICLIFAGVIGIDYSKNHDKAPFDPRKDYASSLVTDPMDDSYKGYIPQDAVILAPDGIYMPDGEDDQAFIKLPDKN